MAGELPFSSSMVENDPTMMPLPSIPGCRALTTAGGGALVPAALLGAVEKGDTVAAVVLLWVLATPPPLEPAVRDFVGEMRAPAISNVVFCTSTSRELKYYTPSRSPFSYSNMGEALAAYSVCWECHSGCCLVFSYSPYPGLLCV